MYCEWYREQEKPPLHPIPVNKQAFSDNRHDIMELTRTAKGNHYVVDFFKKSPLMFPVLNQKADRLAKLIVDKLLPLWTIFV